VVWNNGAYIMDKEKPDLLTVSVGCSKRQPLDVLCGLLLYFYLTHNLFAINESLKATYCTKFIQWENLARGRS